jgi:hypothetical protein
MNNPDRLIPADLDQQVTPEGVVRDAAAVEQVAGGAGTAALDDVVQIEYHTDSDITSVSDTDEPVGEGNEVAAQREPVPVVTSALPKPPKRKAAQNGGKTAGGQNTGSKHDDASGYVHQKGKRGHPMIEVKRNLAQQGKLNAKKPMSPEQKRARRRKRGK